MTVTMLAPPPPRPAKSVRGATTVLARGLLGATLVYLGLTKALEPVEFLKLVRNYHLFDSPLVLNLVSSIVPWFELFCGALLLAGVAVRGTALLVLILLATFTVVVGWRALTVAELSGLALCAVRFDCGCGAGEVLACRKMVENGLLMMVAAILAFTDVSRFCLRPALFKGRDRYLDPTKPQTSLNSDV